MAHPPPSPDDLGAPPAGASDRGAAPPAGAAGSQDLGAPETGGFVIREISPGEVPPPGGYVDLALDADPADLAAPAVSLAGGDERARAREAARASAIAALLPPPRSPVPAHVVLVACGFVALVTAEIAYVVRAAPRRAPEPVFAVAHATSPAPAAAAAGTERRARRRGGPSRTARSEPLPAAAAPFPTGGACPAPREPATDTGVAAPGVVAAQRAPERPEAAVDWSAPVAAPRPESADVEPAKASAPEARATAAPAAGGAAEPGPLPGAPEPLDPPAMVSASAR